MIQMQLPSFLNVVNSGVATIAIPRYIMTLNRIVMRLGGTAFTKAMITDIKVKVGVRVLWQISGPNLDKINKYKGIYDQANFLTLDFTERDAPTLAAQQMGGFDMSVYGEQMTLEVTITGATAPTLSASIWMTPPQKNGLVEKLVYIPASTAVGGKFPIQLSTRGAMLKRLFCFYAGAGGTSTTDGNINRFEVKKNGIVIFDSTDVEARFTQQEYRKVPQSGLFVVDFLVDNNLSSILATADATSMEFNPFLTAGDTMSVYAELLDTPFNA